MNVFPATQNKLMQYLVDKTMNYGNNVLLTTHSPYILTSLNNLMYAYQIGQLYKEKVNEIIEEKYWINFKEVSAYLLKFDSSQKGVVEEIILDKEGLIKAEKIDGVSAILNSDFNAIMDIELNVEK
jgi:predicted ATPase